MSAIVLDAGGRVKAFQKQDGASMLRFEVCYGKAYGSLALGRPSRMVLQKAREKPLFMQSIDNLADYPLFLEGGGQLVRDAAGEVPNVSVWLGNTKTSAAAKISARALPCRDPTNTASGNFRASALRAGPSPTTSLVPGRSSLRKASRFFSTASRPTVKKIGRDKPRSAFTRGLNNSASTPRGHSFTFLNPRAASSEASVGVAASTAAPGAWKRRNQRPGHLTGPVLRYWQPFGQIVWKTRVKACGERQFPPQTEAPHGMTERAFCRDMNRVRLHPLKVPFHVSGSYSEPAGFPDNSASARSRTGRG